MKFVNLFLPHLGKINRCAAKIGVTSFTTPAAMQSVEHRRCYMMMNRLLKCRFFQAVVQYVEKARQCFGLQFGIIIAEDVINLDTIQ